MGFRAMPALAALTALLALPGAAAASRIAVEGDTLAYRADPGEANVGGMNDKSGDYWWAIDFGARVTPGRGCHEAVHPPAREEYHCDRTGVERVLLDAGDRNDIMGVDSTSTPVRLLGGPGRDTLTAYGHTRLEGSRRTT